MVMIDSITTLSVSISMYEMVCLTRARKLDRRCVKGRQASGVNVMTQETNKHQLLHRIQSVKTITNLQYLYREENINVDTKMHSYKVDIR
jgi:hypothetical protein